MKRENIFLKMLGLLIGTIPGIILYVVLSRMRIFASIAVIVIFYGSIYGGEFFSNLFSSKFDEHEIIDEMGYYEGESPLRSKMKYYEEESISKGSIALAILFSLIGAYIAEVLDFTLSIIKEYPEVPFSEAFNFSLVNIFSDSMYLLISCVIILFTGISLMAKKRKMKE